jgi:hypothetical protein
MLGFSETVSRQENMTALSLIGTGGLNAKIFPTQLSRFILGLHAFNCGLI